MLSCTPLPVRIDSVMTTTLARARAHADFLLAAVLPVGRFGSLAMLASRTSLVCSANCQSNAAGVSLKLGHHRHSQTRNAGLPALSLGLALAVLSGQVAAHSVAAAASIVAWAQPVAVRLGPQRGLAARAEAPSAATAPSLAAHLKKKPSGT
jgi:hypothetical protein